MKISALKKIIIWGSLSLTSLGWAGSPQEDFMVRSLRERFMRASAPEAKDLHFKTRWFCHEHEAVLGYNESRYDLSIEFTPFDGIVINQEMINSKVEGPKSFVFTKRGLVSTYAAPADLPKEFGVFYLVFRTDADGSLIGEAAVKVPENWKKMRDVPQFSPSIAINNSAVLSYLLCSQK